MFGKSADTACMKEKAYPHNAALAGGGEEDRPLGTRRLIALQLALEDAVPRQRHHA